MKFLLKYSIVIFIMTSTLFFTSCSSDDNSVKEDELSGLTKVKEFTNDTHTIELYSHKGSLEQGYNEITLQIKDNVSNEYIKDAHVSWMPIMHMSMMNHSCPFSSVEKISTNSTLYKGYIVFQMAQNESEYWDLKIDYSVNGTAYTATSEISVPATTKKTVNSFTGSDGVKYIVAYIDPQQPKVAVNDLTVGVWKMQTMMSFPVVDGYTLKIDPRMPSMGNHSSPNNVNATQLLEGDLYHGKLSLTMTGYWKINLQLINPEGTVLKGETINETVTSSSINFEIEF